MSEYSELIVNASVKEYLQHKIFERLYFLANLQKYLFLGRMPLSEAKPHFMISGEGRSPLNFDTYLFISPHFLTSSVPIFFNCGAKYTKSSTAASNGYFGHQRAHTPPFFFVCCATATAFFSSSTASHIQNAKL